MIPWMAWTRRVVGAFGVAVLAGCAATTAAPPPQLATEEFMVPSREPGIELYVRNKHAAGVDHFAPEKIVLFVHGATYPSETAFDLKLDGISWMEYIAQRGYDVYLVDVRGYGRSTRPPAMDQPPTANPPFAFTEDAANDVGSAVDFILKRRGVSKINLLAWSWGTSIMSLYTTGNNGKVNKLVLYAPSWLRNTPSLVTSGPGAVSAYRTVNMASAKARWLTGVAPDKQAALIPPGWFEAWAAATIASDPWGSKQNPPVVRAPNGVVVDGQRYNSAGKPRFDPAQIRVPVLLIKAEWDADTPAYMAQTLFPLLVNAPYKRYVEIGEGTHSIIMERNRMQLFREVQQFLDESGP
jgi:pimeloyl-ACP methyl ester carboxylesterase